VQQLQKYGSMLLGDEREVLDAPVMTVDFDRLINTINCVHYHEVSAVITGSSVPPQTSLYIVAPCSPSLQRLPSIDILETYSKRVLFSDACNLHRTLHNRRSLLTCARKALRFMSGASNPSHNSITPYILP
jgi:hypothetical protein